MSQTHGRDVVGLHSDAALKYLTVLFTVLAHPLLNPIMFHAQI
jgi:hypothetical protein